MDRHDDVGSCTDPSSTALFVDSREVIATTGRRVDAALARDLLVPSVDRRYRARILTIERVFFALLGASHPARVAGEGSVRAAPARYDPAPLRASLIAASKRPW
jgi:hypothetical protein